ncbi:MAG: YlbF family regulator [Bacillota bacterium]|jgi:cell fate (sporulation/competence/biofilm development) regulator YlbF (YheA/YmcA/DUF963 family)|nr:YlbF family regulator [Bacillota bacterium]HPZ23080.1 YlbF family regulator [Bacillota bacterium]
MIKQKAAELAAAIKDSEEFKGLQSARARVQLDPKAFDLLSKLQVLQGEIIGLQQQGQPITQAVVEQLRDLENQMQLNLTLKNMVEAQQKFDNLMEEVNAVLAEGLS